MKIIAIVACCAGLALAKSSFGAAPYSFDSAPGKLPKSVVPVDYAISIVPDLATKIFMGKETVSVRFRKAGDTIVLHALDIKMKRVLLDGRSVQRVTPDADAQLVTITLAKPVPAGLHKLDIAYAGVIQPHTPGFFAQEFVAPGGAKRQLISTKFEPTYARRLFPCWDEPAFRATFQLTVTVPAAWATVSNMPVAGRVTHGELATTTFQRTPKMPTYLVEFTAGDLAAIGATVGRTKIGVWAARGQEQDGAEALANATQILADYNDYFGVPFPLPKLDSIAVPGGFTGAMENWGAITYNDQLLLLNASSTFENRQDVYSVQAHEMAHQWNGDLVTMGWWDDLWLNESFASWRAAKETDRRKPDWRWWEVEDGPKERAMRADASLSSHAIEQHVGNDLQAQNAFDHEITYQKGQAVLRMLEAYVGPEVFRDGIRKFMKAHAYSNASSADLWNALDTVSGRGVSKVAAGWTEQAGFPLVTVTPSCDAAGRRTVLLAQRRFLLQGSDPTAARWQVPLQLRAGADSSPRAVLLTADGQLVPAGRCGESLSLNAGAVGYFRTQYDADTLQANTKGFAALPWGDRIALLDDQWALVESRAQPLASYLALAETMGTDLNERAWSQVTEALRAIEFDERGTPGHDLFAAYARSLLKPVADRLTWEPAPGEAPGTGKLRRRVLTDIGVWGDADVVAEARKRFAAFVADRSTLGPDDQDVVLTIVARHADSGAFQMLHDIAKSSANETELRRYYSVMMAVADPALAAEAAKIALSDEIAPQAGSVRMQLVGRLADRNPQLAWTTFNQNLDTLLAPYGQYRALLLSQGPPQVFWNAVPLADLEAWIEARVPGDMAPIIARAMDGARFKLDEKALLVGAADDYVMSMKRIAR